MAKARQQTPAPEVPSLPKVGDKVHPPRSEMIYEISKVHVGGSATCPAVNPHPTVQGWCSVQVRFKTLPDPDNPGGFLVSFETVGSVVQQPNPLSVTFKSKFDLDSA